MHYFLHLMVSVWNGIVAAKLNRNSSSFSELISIRNNLFGSACLPKEATGTVGTDGPDDA
jgi:hypothetical protein